MRHSEERDRGSREPGFQKERGERISKMIAVTDRESNQVIGLGRWGDLGRVFPRSRVGYASQIISCWNISKKDFLFLAEIFGMQLW